MQIILASAKIMNDKVKSSPDISLSSPRFKNEADCFARDMAQYYKVFLRQFQILLQNLTFSTQRCEE